MREGRKNGFLTLTVAQHATGADLAKSIIKNRKRRALGSPFPVLTMAGLTGLEPATSGVTGRRCNRLYYSPF